MPVMDGDEPGQGTGEDVTVFIFRKAICMERLTECRVNKLEWTRKFNTIQN